MAQENENDMTAKFSTLNVNAMEFVPSFGICQERKTTNEEPNESKTPENNG